MATILLLLLCVLFLGCGGNGNKAPEWGIQPAEATGVDPAEGEFSFDQTGCFRVVGVGADKLVEFASDCFRFDRIAVREGAFIRFHGQIGGTDCPTDSYAISGRFVSPRRAQGTIAYASDCRVRRRAEFVAELPDAVVTAEADNSSVPTTCAEEDNVTVLFRGAVASFLVEATHPDYEVGHDNCEPDFSGCPPPGDDFPFSPGVFELYDDGEWVVEAVREQRWWRPNGMRASLDSGTRHENIHYVRIYRKVSGSEHWPQFFVFYMDGNARLIPHPPEGRERVCFGPSVQIGPVAVEERPIAEVSSVNFVSSSKTLEVLYEAGGTATLEFPAVSRARSVLRVGVDYPSALPFAAFRSMFVAPGNCDTERVSWLSSDGSVRDDPVLAFRGGEGTSWFFYRRARSLHNTSSPDIRVTLGSP